MLRLEVLLREGGVYVDTDMECVRSIEPLIEGLDFFTAYLKPRGKVNNAFIGAVPNHPILERAVAELEPRSVYGYDKAAAGPVFFDELLKSYPEVTKLPAECFYPATPAQQEDAYAIHHAARSWKDAAGFKEAALRAEARLGEAQKELASLERRYKKARAEIARLKGERPGRIREWLSRSAGSS